jgi:hypothetical protein
VKPTSKRVNLDSTIGTERIHHRSSEGRGVPVEEETWESASAMADIAASMVTR